MKKFKQLLIALMAVLTFCGSTITVFADEDGSSIQYSTDEEKDHVRGKLNRYYSDSKKAYG